VFVLTVVFAGLLAAPLVVVVEFEVVVVVPLAFVVELLVVLVVDVVAFALVLTVALRFVRFAFAFAVLVFAASPQAIPKALTARTVESTITFFI
jgi:hypothetical protein